MVGLEPRTELRNPFIRGQKCGLVEGVVFILLVTPGVFLDLHIDFLGCPVDERLEVIEDGGAELGQASQLANASWSGEVPQMDGATEVNERQTDKPRETEDADAAPLEADERKQQPKQQHHATCFLPTALKALENLLTRFSAV